MAIYLGSNRVANAHASGGSTPTLIPKNITSNGTYTAASDNADGYSQVTVNVEHSFVAEDEGKVVSNGALVSQTSTTKNANGTYDTTTNNQIIVAIPLANGVSF